MKTIGPVHRVRGRMTANLYLLEGDDGLVLVDAGGYRDATLIEKATHRLGASIEEISHILLTHFHVDHAAAAADLKDMSGATVLAHREDVPILRGEEYFPSVFKNSVLGRALGSERLAGTVKWVASVPPVEVDVELDEGDIVPVLGGIEVIHGPGHTPGSMALLWEGEKAVFTGDIIINTFHFPGFPTKGFSYDWDLVRESAKKVANIALERDIRLLCPGHGPMIYENVRPRLERFLKGNHRISRML